MKTDVVTNDGTTYRVTFSERTYPIKYCRVEVRVKRKWFGWRTVATENFRHGQGAYDAQRPDFVKMAQYAVMFYHIPRTLRNDSARNLRKWDGRVDV